jgi:hypothetical protein
MADPFTAATAASSAISIGGSLFGASSASAAGADRARMDNYRAYVSAQNARIALQNRDRDVAVGNVQAFNQDLKMREKIGSAEADAGASGFDVGSGSIKAGISSLHQLGRMDTLNLIDSSRQKAYGDLIQSYNFTQEALMGQSAAQNDLTAGDTQAMSTLIGGASSVADRWAGYYRRTA